MGVNEAAESDREVDSMMGLNLMGTETFEPTIGYWTGVGDFELIQRWHLEERQFQLMGLSDSDRKMSNQTGSFAFGWWVLSICEEAPGMVQI